MSLLKLKLSIGNPSLHQVNSRALIKVLTMLKYIKGDLIDLSLAGEFDAIIHGCNCFCKMGSGMALAIKNTFPNAYEVDLKTIPGDKSKLGSFTFSLEKNNLGKDLYVFNSYTQYRYGYNNEELFEYEAFEKSLRAIKEKFTLSSYGLPLIGAGLAGGNWQKIEAIIDRVLGDKNTSIVVLQKRP